MEVDMVTIPRSEHENLKEAQAILEALMVWGVDNWSGYEDSIKRLKDAQ
jgi:hypothetical protein